MSAPHESPTPSPSDQAIAWHVRLHSGVPMEEAEQERFLAWLGEPAHQTAWEETLQLSEQLEQPARMLASEFSHITSTPPSRAGPPTWMAVAALLLCCVVIYCLLR